MKRRTYKRLFSFLLCFVLFMNVSVTAMATENVEEDVEEEPIIEASEVLNDKETAQQTLSALVLEREISALLYLKDIYTIKAEPNSGSEDVVSIASGQEVLITGVDTDKGGNIWYQVVYRYDEGEFQGYIERTYLAFADERLREWEAENISSRVRMFALRRAINYADVEQFPESYRDALYQLKQRHPNWTFVKMETGLDWNEVVKAQAEADRNLIYANTSKDSWMEGMYDSTWAYASDGIIKYFLDPRNALTESLVFQFEQLTYNKSYHSAASTQKVLEGTFMDSIIPGTDSTYVSAFMSIASDKNVSPLLIASRIRQEQGVAGTSALISGTYPGYEGLFNYYNIGASGNTTEKVVVSGLKKAREMGWTTRLLSLSGGADFLTHSYVKRGQDTLYLQKFDVDNSYDGIYWHQYMQNVQAPTTEAKSTYRAYSSSGIVDSPFVFKIPVYKNMPSYACIQPGSEDKITLNTTMVSNLPVGQTAVLTSYINGTQNTSVAMSFTSSDTQIATVDEKGVVTGVAPGEVTITCKKAENPDGATTATCSVTIVKADISISDIKYPQIEVTYSPTQTLSMIDLPSGFAWVDGSIVPIVVNGGYSVTYNPDNSKYNTLTLSIPVTVKKAVIDKASLALPTDLKAVAGYELKSVSLPAGYAWTDASQVLPKKVGTYQYKASYCMDEVNYEVVEDITLSVKVVCKTHEFGEWNGNHADCINVGKLTRSCSICGKSETVTEEAIGHEYQSKIIKEPTVISTGVRKYTCIRCNDTYEAEIPAVEAPHKHEYTEAVTVEASCETTGAKTFTCSCGDVYTEVMDALGHDLADGVCSRCGYTVPTLPQHTHSYTLSESTETCTDDGVATYVCGCGDSYTENTKALSHNVVNGKCTRCDYKEAENDNTGNVGNGTGSTGENTGSNGNTNTSGSNAGSTGDTNNSGSSAGSTGDTNNSGSSAGSTGGTSNSGSSAVNTGGTNNSGSSAGSTGGTSNSGSSAGNTGGTSNSGSSTGNTGGTSNSGSNAGSNGDTNNSGSNAGSIGDTNNGGSSAGSTGGTSNSGSNAGSTGNTNNSGNTNGSSGGNTGDTNNSGSNSGSTGGTNNGGSGTGNTGGTSNSGSNVENAGNTDGTSNSGSNVENAGNTGGTSNSGSNGGSTDDINNSGSGAGSTGGTSNSGSSAGNIGDTSNSAGSEGSTSNSESNRTENASASNTSSEGADSDEGSKDTSNGTGILAAIQNALTGSNTSDKAELTANVDDAKTQVDAKEQNQNASQSQIQEIMMQSQDISQTQGTASLNQDEKENASEDADVNEQIVEDEAIKITMKHSTVLDKEKLAVVTDEQRNLKLVMNDDIIWKVDLTNVEDLQSLHVDMGVTLNKADIPEEVLVTLPSQYPCILMSLAHDGEFEFGASLSVPVNKVNQGKYANLFYYNPDTKAMEFITDSIVAEDGTAVFEMDHASDYAIILAEKSLNPNPVEEVLNVETGEQNVVKETKDNNSILIVILIIVIIAVLVAGVMAGMKFIKKKAEDNYYFDEDDAPEEE